MCMHLDDILVTGKTMEDHLDHLEAVFTRLREEVEEREMPVLDVKGGIPWPCDYQQWLITISVKGGCDC